MGFRDFTAVKERIIVTLHKWGLLTIDKTKPKVREIVPINNRKP